MVNKTMHCYPRGLEESHYPKYSEPSAHALIFMVAMNLITSCASSRITKLSSTRAGGIKSILRHCQRSITNERCIPNDKKFLAGLLLWVSMRYFQTIVIYLSFSESAFKMFG